MSGFEDYVDQGTGDNLLARIAAAARRVQELRQRLTELEADRQQEQRLLDTLLTQTIPDLLSEAQQDDLTTVDGLRVTKALSIHGSLPKGDLERRARAIAWLRANGHGGVVKAVLEADLGKPTEEQVQAALTALEGVGVHGAAREDVNHMTLKALVREVLERGDPVPLDDLGVHVATVAEVKVKK